MIFVDQIALENEEHHKIPDTVHELAFVLFLDVHKFLYNLVNIFETERVVSCQAYCVRQCSCKLFYTLVGMV